MLAHVAFTVRREYAGTLKSCGKGSGQFMAPTVAGTSWRRRLSAAGRPGAAAGALPRLAGLVLALHEGHSAADRRRRARRRFADAFDMVVPDMPGYGYSDRPTAQTGPPLDTIAVAGLGPGCWTTSATSSSAPSAETSAPA
jgi:pimeloyl-ACP methyl ester carboxylesterase